MSASSAEKPATYGVGPGPGHYCPMCRTYWKAGDAPHGGLCPHCTGVQLADGRPPTERLGAAQPARSESSAEKPATYAVFDWYNIGWVPSRFKNLRKHEKTLRRDLSEATETKVADVILLSECGEIGVGLGPDWEPLVRSCCGPGFAVAHQSHYTSIVRTSTMEVLEGPELKGPLCREHDFRMVQYLKVRLRDSAEKPIKIFNLHSPSSNTKN